MSDLHSTRIDYNHHFIWGLGPTQKHVHLHHTPRWAPGMILDLVALDCPDVYGLLAVVISSISKISIRGSHIQYHPITQTSELNHRKSSSDD